MDKAEATLLKPPDGERMMQPTLTRSALLSRDRELWAARTSNARIMAYSMDGSRVGAAWVGEGDQRLTFPAKLTAETVLGFRNWIKEAPEGSPKWYEDLGDWQPTAIIFTNGTIGNHEDPVGLHGDTIWLVDTAINQSERQCVEMQVMDLSEVRTPETPTEVESEQSWYWEEIAIKTPSFEAVPDETSQPDDASSAASAASVLWKEASWHRMVNELLLGSATAMETLQREATDQAIPPQKEDNRRQRQMPRGVTWKLSAGG